jgi:hypothetical protein
MAHLLVVFFDSIHHSPLPVNPKRLEGGRSDKWNTGMVEGWNIGKSTKTGRLECRNIGKTPKENLF